MSRHRKPCCEHDCGLAAVVAFVGAGGFCFGVAWSAAFAPPAAPQYREVAKPVAATVVTPAPAQPVTVLVTSQRSDDTKTIAALSRQAQQTDQLIATLSQQVAQQDQALQQLSAQAGKLAPLANTDTLRALLATVSQDGTSPKLAPVSPALAALGPPTPPTCDPLRFTCDPGAQR